MATIAERMLRALATSGPLDDDVLAGQFGVIRQSVNQVARRLESQGRIQRCIGPDGKIVNALNDGSTVSPTETTAPSSPVRLPEPDRVLTEDEVKAAVRDYLEERGYRVTVAWARARGIDIDAQGQGCRLIIEAKGQTKTPGSQQVNYFLGALGELLQRMDDPAATYAVAFPDHPQYRGLVNRLPALARQRLGLVVYFVSRSGGGYAVDEDRAGRLREA